MRRQDGRERKDRGGHAEDVLHVVRRIRLAQDKQSAKTLKAFLSWQLSKDAIADLEASRVTF